MERHPSPAPSRCAAHKICGVVDPVTAKPEREPLSRERILAAALARIDEVGLDGLSMRRLGHDLGVEAMSLYNYFPSKDAMLDGVVELLLSSAMSTPPPGVDDWRARVRLASESFHGLARRHPKAFPLFVLRPIGAYVSGRVFVETTIAALVDAGFDHTTAVRAFRTLSRYIVGFSMSEAASAGVEVAVPNELAADAPLALEAVRDLHDTGTEALFTFGLDLILTGLEARLAQQVS